MGLKKIILFDFIFKKRLFQLSAKLKLELYALCSLKRVYFGITAGDEEVKYNAFNKCKV